MSDRIFERFPAHLVKEQTFKHGGRYIEHSQIRQRLLQLQADGLLRWEWSVIELRHLDGDWIVHGRLLVMRPEVIDGRTHWSELTHEVIGEPWPNPASAESRAFTRAVAFATGIGLQAWTGEAGYWLDKPRPDDE